MAKSYIINWKYRTRDQGVRRGSAIKKVEGTVFGMIADVYCAMAEDASGLDNLEYIKVEEVKEQIRATDTPPA